MPFLIETFDKPGCFPLREQLRDSHLAYLDTIGSTLLACGGKLSDDGSTADGGIYLVDVETRHEAETLIAADPFNKGGLFARVHIQRWRKAYLDGVSYLPGTPAPTPELTITPLTNTPTDAAQDKPLLVVGPSLGTSVSTLWKQAADALGGSFTVLGFDLPGHGRSAPFPHKLDIDDLADAVVAAVDAWGLSHGLRVDTFSYAGVSVSGQIGLAVASRYPRRVNAAAIINSGATIGIPSAWRERAETVSAHGTASQVDGSREKWFGPRFVDEHRENADALLAELPHVDDSSYAAICGALAGFDATDWLGSIAQPVVAIAGSRDLPAPPAKAEEIADHVQHGTVVVLDNVGHLAPAEQPEEVAHILSNLLMTTTPSELHDHIPPSGASHV